MGDVAQLSDEERQWLQAVHRGPLVRLSVERKVPAPILESLLAKRLVTWRRGFAAVALLVVTARGETVSA